MLPEGRWWVWMIVTSSAQRAAVVASISGTIPIWQRRCTLIMMETSRLNGKVVIMCQLQRKPVSPRTHALQLTGTTKQCMAEPKSLALCQMNHLISLYAIGSVSPKQFDASNVQRCTAVWNWIHRYVRTFSYHEYDRYLRYYHHGRRSIERLSRRLARCYAC